MRRAALTVAALLLAAPATAQAHPMSYGQARDAALARANRAAGQSTRLTDLYVEDRRSRHLHAWRAEATWSPGADARCWLDMRVRYRAFDSRSIVVQVLDRGCGTVRSPVS